MEEDKTKDSKSEVSKAPTATSIFLKATLLSIVFAGVFATHHSFRSSWLWI